MLRVIIVDDEPYARAKLERLLADEDAELLAVCANGREAAAAIEQLKPDLVFLDIQMPEMDGIAATRAIRAREAELGAVRIPIIALSAHAMTHQVNEYLGVGFDLHVPKPIELPRLQAALEQAMAIADAARAADAGAAEPRLEGLMV